MNLFIRRATDCLLILAYLTLGVASIPAQDQPERPRPDQDDVIRVNTELVQTDVMVFDKKGHFVEGLKPDQFMLKVDNKPRTVSFLEHVKSGDVLEQRKTQLTPGSENSATVIRGRTVFFFVDDLHLASEVYDNGKLINLI